MTDRHVGLLVVHGIGEQKRFETARQLARSILAGLQARDDGAHFSLIDRSANAGAMPMNCPRIDRDGSPFMISCRAEGSQDCTYVHLHEVWWSDLGAPATLGEQVRFWLWGLGQWSARVVWDTHFKDRVSNTDLLMTPPTKFKDVAGKDSNASARPVARVMLFLTALYALLTLFSWEAVKRAFSWASSAAGSPAILTSYVGDVRIYTQAPGRGGGNITDVGQPWRTTIRRRMVSELLAMAERGYDRWYLFGHSLGSIVAFNAVQEPEWNLPNYLDPSHIARIKAGASSSDLRLATALGKKDPKPDLKRMMPRRPIWLGDTDRIARKALFAKFGGLVTYGSPLDKFAALWPRIVPINKQRDVFPADADWINLSDATDPVGGRISAFTEGWNETTPADQSPTNIRMKASPFFLLAHIRYFVLPSLKKKDRADTLALVDLLFPAGGQTQRLSAAFAQVGRDYGSPAARAGLAFLWIVALGAALVVATSWLARIVKGLGDKLFAGVTHWLNLHWPRWALIDGGIGLDLPERIWRCGVRILQILPIAGFAGTMATTVVVAILVVALAGFWRRRGEA